MSIVSLKLKRKSFVFRFWICFFFFSFFPASFSFLFFCVFRCLPFVCVFPLFFLCFTLVFVLDSFVLVSVLSLLSTLIHFFRSLSLFLSPVLSPFLSLVFLTYLSKLIILLSLFFFVFVFAIASRYIADGRGGSGGFCSATVCGRRRRTDDVALFRCVADEAENGNATQGRAKSAVAATVKQTEKQIGNRRENREKKRGETEKENGRITKKKKLWSRE